MTNETNPWTLYWQQDTQHSCIASRGGADAAAIDSLWLDYAATLAPGAQVLDLATGNGAVPVAMLQPGIDIAITAIDRADIAPPKFLKRPGRLAEVLFLGNVDVAHLPLANRYFDALCSQFGIEYGDLPQVAREAARVLKPGGSFQFLMHHRSSSIVEPNTRLISELDAALEKGGLIEAVGSFVAGSCTACDLEHRGEEYLRTPGSKTRQISGQVFNAIGTIIEQHSHSPRAAVELAATLVTRLRAERARLAQMAEASLTSGQVQLFVNQLGAAGLAPANPEPLWIGEGEQLALVGWLVSGSKP